MDNSGLFPVKPKPTTPNRFVSSQKNDLSETMFAGIQPGEKNRQFLLRTFEDGTTYGQRWNDLAAERMRAADGQLSLGDDVPTKPRKKPNPDSELGRAEKKAEKVALLDTKPPETMEEAFEQSASRFIHDIAVDTLRKENADAFALYERRVEELMTREREPIKEVWVARVKALDDATRGTSWRITRGYDTFLSIVREIALFNPVTGLRYILNQAVGNDLTLAATGHGGAIPEVVRNYQSALNDMAPDSFVNKMVNRGHIAADGQLTTGAVDAALKDMGDWPIVAVYDPVDDRLTRLGVSRHQQDVVSTSVRDQVTGDPTKPLKIEEVADRFRLGRLKLPAGKLTGVLASRNVRDAAVAWDLAARKGLFGHLIDANITEARPFFRQMMEQELPRGADMDLFARKFDELGEFFSPEQIREQFADFGANYADRMARDWTNSTSLILDNAREEVKRVLFSGQMTNADQYLSRVIMFHYWASRATPLYTQALLTHAGFLNAFIRLQQELAEQAESGEYGQSVNGMLKFFGTPFGFNIFIRPEAMIQTVMSYGTQANDFAPEGEAGFVKWMRKSGLFFNPLIQTGLNLAGYVGDTFAPDPLMLYNHVTAFKTSVDLMKAHGWWPGDGTPTQDRVANFWDAVRGETSGILPGSTEVPAGDSVLYARQQVNYLIQDVAEERGLDPNGPEAIAAMDDPDSDLYREAFRRFANAGGLGLAMKLAPTSLLYPRLRLARPDEIRYDLANMETGTPVAERDALYQQREMARAGEPASRQLLDQQNQYYDLGTPEQQDSYETYEEIQRTGLTKPVKINGVMVTERHLDALTSDQREMAADAWAAENGKTEDIQAIRDARKAFRETHPEYGAFVEWRSGVYDYPGGPLEWWQDAADGNPNAERWLADMEDLPLDEVDRRLTSTEAYMNYAGIRPTTYDPNPLPTRDMANVPYNPNEATGGTGQQQQWQSQTADPATRINEQISNYQQDMALYNMQVQAVFGEPINMEGLPPNVRSSYETILADHGVRPPSLGQDASDYIQWRNAQMPGSDVSLDAYLRWQAQWTSNTSSVPTFATSGR